MFFLSFFKLGLGRSKFLPKPLPQEINMLLAECDVNCHHESTEQQSATTACSTMAKGTTAATVSVSMNKCSGNMETLDEDDDDDNRAG